VIDVLLANPRGFCAGVDRAIEIVERALTTHGAPIYVRHEVVHNRFVVENLEKKGAVFVENLDEVPSGSILIFRYGKRPKSENSRYLTPLVRWLQKFMLKWPR
jgi:4-hydroxy-3-methylbut-2-enyl diphosphate reductase